MDGLVPGRIVYYVFSEHAADEVNRRRTNSLSIAERLKAHPPQWPAGAQAHIGNVVSAGDIYPAMVIRVWSQDSGCSNLKVLLDGADDFWATSISHADDKRPHSWHWMFQGQAQRYDATKVQPAVAP